FLSNAQIAKVLAKYRKSRSTEIAERLLEEIYRLNDPDQDNISFTVIKVNDASVRPKVASASRDSVAVSRPRGLTKVVAQPTLLPVLTEDQSPAFEREEAATVVSLPVAEEAATVVSLPIAETAEVAAPAPVPDVAQEAAEEEAAPARVVVPRRFAALA
ncbi:MAG: hypothetical protein ACKO2N_20405, partial [Tabrizicola sp.]